MHGGAWLYGNKRGQAYPLMSHLAERGWVCVSLNYRLSPRSTWPDQILDVKRAMAWVKTHIAEHGGDPGFVAITGGSAGGHLSALHALTARDRLWQPGFEDVDTSVVAAAPFYGVYDWTNRDGTGGRGLVALLERRVVKAPIAATFDVFDAASPMSHVGADAPPFFVLHGTHDTLVPVAQARAFVSLLREVVHGARRLCGVPGRAARLRHLRLVARRRVRSRGRAVPRRGVRRSPARAGLRVLMTRPDHLGWAGLCRGVPAPP